MSRETQLHPLEREDLGIDPTLGGELKPDGSRLIEMFRQKEHKMPVHRAIPMTLDAMRNAGCSWPQIATYFLGLARVWMGTSLPKDTEILSKKDPAAQRVILPMISHFVAPGSRIEGKDNLEDVMGKNAKGEPVLFYSFPHISALDPVFLQIVLKREAEKTDDADWEQAARSMYAQLLVLIGQKVMHSRYRRMFAAAVDAIPTIPPKYRADLPRKDKELASAHSQNVKILMDAASKHPEVAMLVYPQGGFTTDDQIGFQPMTAMVPPETWITPIFESSTLAAPLRPEMGKDMQTDPTELIFYVGQPFQLPRGGGTRSLEAMIMMCRNNVAAVGAPDHKYAFGYMKRCKGTEKGEEFVPLITKRQPAQ